MASQAAGLSVLQPSPLHLRYYQLTHDYLVPSLREWLTRKQKETRKGRAELKLAERSASGSETGKPHLPSLTEWLSIRTLTESKHWTAPQRAMMSRGFQVHGIRTAFAAVLALLLVSSGLSINKSINDRQKKLLVQKQEEQNQAEATRLVEGLLAANTAQVSTSLASLKDFRTWADPQLLQAFNDSAADSDARLHAGLALAAEGQAVDSSSAGVFMRPVADRHSGTVCTGAKVTRTSQSRTDSCVLENCRQTTSNLPSDASARPVPWRHSIRLILLGMILSSSALLAEQLVAVSPEYISEFKELLRPVAPQLVPALSNIFKDPGRGELAKTLATSLLADYAAKDPDTLTESRTGCRCRVGQIDLPCPASSIRQPL